MATTSPWYGVTTAALLVVGTAVALDLGLSAPDTSPVTAPVVVATAPAGELHGHNHSHHRGGNHV
jgi:hypothetical protein